MAADVSQEILYFFLSTGLSSDLGLHSYGAKGTEAARQEALASLPSAHFPPQSAACSGQPRVGGSDCKPSFNSRSLNTYWVRVVSEGEQSVLSMAELRKVAGQ